MITTEFTFDLATTELRKDLVDNAIKVMGNSLCDLVSSFSHCHAITAIDDYQHGSNWKTA